MTSWHYKNDQELTAQDIAEMRRLALLVEPGGRSAGMPNNTDTLMEAVDLLWGLLGPQQVADLADDAPEIVALCQIVHEKVSHD